jgi:hypothetical protein
LPSGRLTPLQERVLALLAEVTPPWTLTGGGALAGFHLAHRATRDLDLFWHDRAELGSLGAEVAHRLSRAGLAVENLQTAPTFERLRVRDGKEDLILDLVAESVPAIEAPAEAAIAGTRIRIDTRHEILVNKLCTLLGRKELRDLRDLRELLRTGGDLERALADAPRKDGGFSPLMVAWVLKGTSIPEMAPVGALTSQELAELVQFRDELVAQLTRAASPE